MVIIVICSTTIVKGEHECREILSAAKNLPALMRNHQVMALCETQHLSYQIAPLFVLTVGNVTFR